jgi:hypothetical protein
VANPDLLNPAHMYGQPLYSGRLSSTSATAVYTSAANTATKITQAVVDNTSGAIVYLTVAQLKSGDTDDGTHNIITLYPLAALETLTLENHLVGAFLEPGGAISVTVSTANVVTVALSGVVIT